MRKTKLAIGLMTAILTAGTLAGCDTTVRYSADGKIITYKEGDNLAIDIKADDLLNDYYKDSSKFQSIFDAINSIVVRNYFTETHVVDTHKKDQAGNPITVNLGKDQMGQIEIDAKRKVESDKKTAQTNASNNGTSYSDEFETILSSKGAEDEDELKENYIEELKKETFDTNFYKYYVSELKNGDESVKYTVEGTDVKKQLWNGYFEDMVPYHVSHILVKLEDGSGTNYANGTISADNAKKLYNVVNELSDLNNTDSFGTIARRYSEDTGSASNFGDLGIMDYSTGYVNEFKLGIYAYENFMGSNIEDVADSNIDIPGNMGDTIIENSIADNYLQVSKKSFGAEVPEIEFSVFEDLNECADTDKDANNKSVIDDSANFYPRNIIYNKYLNRHSVALITTDDASLVVPTDSKKTTGFVLAADAGVTATTANPYVLAVKTASGWTPVLCARAGSDYQGIHFIIVNRSKFVETDNNGVSLDNYYTTYYPEQEDYPVDSEGNKLPTYVNFSSQATTDTKAKADSFLSTLKSYDSERLTKYIFQKFFEIEGIKIKNEELDKVLKMWIYRGFDKKEQEADEAWEKTWNDYIDTLRKQNSEREKLVSDACRIAYLNGNGLDKDRNEVYLKDVIDDLAQAMIDAGEIDPRTKEPFTDLAKAKEYILSIRIGSNIKEGAIKADDTTLVSVLFKKEGALCNDGKEHL